MSNATAINGNTSNNSTLSSIQLQRLAYNWARKQALKKCTVIGSLILR